MIQDRNHNLFHSLLMTFRKSRKHEESEAQDPSVLESRRKIEQRIEAAIGNITNSAHSAPQLLGYQPSPDPGRPVRSEAPPQRPQAGPLSMNTPRGTQQSEATKICA